MWIIRTDRCVFRSSGSSAAPGEDQTVTSVFAARVICHLRRGPTQCELSEQVVPTRPRSRLARRYGRMPWLARCEPGWEKGNEEDVSERDRAPGAGSAGPGRETWHQARSGGAGNRLRRRL